ncbi:MAG: ABC transporter ATP-binding protein [Rhodobacterales bacterium 32-67-9]|nr:MAG: ABC transporter ATP-binding protein [Rhodobacterales bacterium 32-67-9]
MIEADIRVKSFGGAPVLRDIRFRVATGEVLAILGPSGIGKSTLLRIVAGIDSAFEGTVARPERLSMAFQEPTLLPWRTVAENLTLVHPSLGREGAVAALARVGIEDRADLFPRQLSLGQQRRVALARAFAGDPEALILDEPFASLDPATADEMLALTEGLIAGSRPATIFVTHSEPEAARLATRILRLGGRPATIRPDKEAG